MRVGPECGARVVRVARPPSDGDLLGIHRVAHDEVGGRDLGRPAREEAHREVERTPPGVDRRRATAVGRSERGQDLRGAGRGGEICLDMARIEGRMLVVLVERRRPRHLLRRRIDLDRASEVTDRREHPAGHRADRSIGRQRDTPHASFAVLDDRFVGVQVERDDDRTRAVGCRQWKRLPAACGEAQGGVLELGLVRRQRRRQLAQNLCVRMERVERGLQRVIGKLGPAARHATHAT